ncbi:MAG: phosphoenolpyruvate carboxylase [Steroidobacteraceae bacterium]|nr:phosphoenolpyruvate carboxylase [Pseudomonadales bacterium]MCP5328320.1 phosphoenolpyruvate carboxylase [Nevskiaceae bacterium]MCP5359633.1 phosphoenolpyruvate carboxylase [Nevskiaceae bacterium]MCP5472573.1 phosphoenolpyruvate carboxylase [Nevskiaceae bacterium]
MTVSRDDIQFPPRHAALREDVRQLGALVGEILREQGGQVLFDLVERDRTLAISRRDGDGAAATELALRVRDRPTGVARDLERAFSMWFQVVNLAEKVHRIRRRREYFLSDGDRQQPRGIGDVIAQLKAAGLPLEEVFALLDGLRIELVFVAHPNESARRTILRKQQRVAELLFDRLDPTLAPYEKRSIWGRMRTELTTAWQTEDHPRERLTVADEREHVIFYLAEVLYRLVPAFYDEIALALENAYGVQAESLVLPTIIRFGSWVGGDMNGNPDVQAKTLRETLARQQQVIVNAYFTDCQALAQSLSQSASRIGVSSALMQRIDEYARLIPSAQAITPARHDRMPYRVFLGQVAERLRYTYDGRPNGYENPGQFRRDIQIIGDSLLENRGRNAGYFSVQRLLRRISTFGFHLATVDVRQHAEVHHQVLARGLDDAAWSQRGAAERHRLLADAIERDLGPRAELDALGKRTLAVFESMLQCRRRYGPDAVGLYVVDGVHGPDDVLAPLLLAQWAEAYDKRTDTIALDLAPQFDSVETLERCGDVMRDLLADRLYRRHVDRRGRRQVVLVGYSQSAKESGICASRFAVYRAQGAIAASLAAAGEQHLVFHARGGSIARGGGRIDTLVEAMPPSTVNGLLRLTEQGELVSQNYGLPPIAMRTLERAFGALALATQAGRTMQAAEPSAAVLEVGATLAAASQQRYRQLVWDEPQFHEYFRDVTPIDVIERMQIAARPASRPGRVGVDGLRGVPWVFAWTQTRALLPGWFGAGSGISATIEAHGLAGAQSAFALWPFFRALVNDVEAMLARTDLDIAAAYNALASPPLQRLFATLREEYALACRGVLAIKQQVELLDGDRTLQRAIRLRNPYVDPMNLMQVDLLRRWRATGRADHDLFEALQASISGIAQGLQSTG